MAPRQEAPPLWEIKVAEGCVSYSTVPVGPFQDLLPTGNPALTEALTSAAEAFSSSLRESLMVLKGSSGDKEDPSQAHGVPRLIQHLPCVARRDSSVHHGKVTESQHPTAPVLARLCNHEFFHLAALFPEITTLRLNYYQ